MITIDYWEQFSHTGKIDDYLAFKSMTEQSQTAVKEFSNNAYNNRRYSNT